MKLPLLQYAPDLDPTTPGLITGGNGFIPTLRGIAGAPTPLDTALDPLPAACIGAASLRRLDGTNRFFACTATRIYEAGATTWTDRSAGAPSDYVAVSGRWRLAQFGNVSLAASKENTLQESTTTAFSPISGAPKADIVETVGAFVMAFNVNDGTDKPHGWACSAISNHASWTPSIATQAANGVLTSIPGKITAARRFGDQVVVYKERGMYLGYYSGPPFIWSFTEIPSDTGTWCQESVVNIGTPEQPKHFFVGQEDFYVFDGGRPQPVGLGVKESFFAELNLQEADQIVLLHDRKRSLVYVFYPTGSSTSLNAALIWDYRTGRWGVDNRSIQFATEFVDAEITYDGLGSRYTTYDSLPNAPYDEAFLSGGAGKPALFNTSRKLQTLGGAAQSASLITGDYGDDVHYALLTRVKPKWIVAPLQASLQTFHRASLGDSLSAGPTATMASARFDVLQSARWHRLQLNLTGPFELNALEVALTPAGKE